MASSLDETTAASVNDLSLEVGNSSHNSGTIKCHLKGGINLESLVHGKGSYFEIDDKELEDLRDDDIEQYNDSQYLTGEQCETKDEIRKLGGLALIDSVEENYDEIALQMESLTEDGGVKKMILKEGNGINVPQNGRAFIHYVSFSEGTSEAFDSTLIRGVVVPIEMNEVSLVIRGLYVGVSSMKNGEVAKFIFSPEYAYGILGCPPRIPPQTDLMFIVEVVNILTEAELKSVLFMSPEQRAELPFDEICKASKDLQDKGNWEYRNFNFYPAIKRYQKGISLLEDYPIIGAENEAIRCERLYPMYMNLTQCFLKVHSYARACVSSKLALRCNQQKSINKLYYRFASAKLGLNHPEAAKDICKRGLKLVPDDKDLLILMNKIDAEMKEIKSEEKALYKRMMGMEVRDEKTDDKKTDA